MIATGAVVRLALAVLAFSLYPACSLGEPPSEPRVRPLRELSDAARGRLYSDYAVVFSVLGKAAACGLEWQATYDDFMLRLDHRHGALEMDGGRGTIPALVRNAVTTGREGQLLGKNRQPITCSEAAERLYRLQLPLVPEPLVLRPGERVRPDSPGALEGALVFPDSEFMRAVYAEKLGADWQRALWMREILGTLRDHEAVAALERHLQLIALAALTREAPPPGGSLDEIVEHQRGTGPALARLRAKLLASTLAARVDEQNENQFPVSVYIENVGKGEVAQFDAALQLGDLELRCRPLGRQPELRAGIRGWYQCGEEHRYTRGPELAKAMQARKPGTPWSLRVSRINFRDPPVSFHAEGAYWLDAWPQRSAQLDLKAAGCGARGSCLAEVRQHLAGGRGVLYKLVVNLVLWGLLAAALAFLSPRRRLIAAGVLSALFLALWLAAVMQAFSANSLAAAALVIYGPLFFAWFLGVLWAIVLAMHLYQRQKRS